MILKDVKEVKGAFLRKNKAEETYKYFCSLL